MGRKPTGASWTSCRAVRDAARQSRLGRLDDLSLDDELCQWLAGTLRQLAETSHEWPGPEKGFAEPADWQAALNKAAGDLAAYADGPGDGAVEDDGEQARYAAAQSALHWVADHLGSLWD